MNFQSTIKYLFLLTIFTVPEVLPADSKGVIEEIRIYGLRKTDEWLVRHYLTFSEGDQFNDAEGHRSWRRLQESRLFLQVSLYPQKGSTPGTVLILIPVVERKSTFSTRFTSGYEPVYGLYGTAIGNTYNPFGRGRKLDLYMTGAEMRVASGLTFIHPYILKSERDVEVSLEYSLAKERLNPYDNPDNESYDYIQELYGGGLSTETHLNPVYSYTLGLELLRAVVTDTNTAFALEYPDNPERQTILTFQQSATRDTRTKEDIGWVITGTLREGVSFYEMSSSYLSANLESNHLFTLLKAQKFGLSWKAGTGFRLPLHERYFVGTDIYSKGFLPRGVDQQGGDYIFSCRLSYVTPFLDWWRFWKEHGRLGFFTGASHAWDSGIPEVGDFHTASGVDFGLTFERIGLFRIMYSLENSISIVIQIGTPSMFTYYNIQRI